MNQSKCRFAMRVLLFFLLIQIPSFIFSQNLKIEWEKSIDGSSKIHAVVEATNGYLLAVGETSSKTKGGSDGLLIIVDHSSGQIIHELRYGGSKDDVLNGAVQTYDGRFLLAGSTNSSGEGSSDAWVLLVDEKGEMLWEKTFGTKGKDECLAMKLLADGDVLLAGTQNNGKTGDVWLAKLHDQTLVWEKTLGNSEFETLGGLALATDGGYVFCGNTGKKAEKGTGDIYLAKADANGDLKWNKVFGEGSWEEALDLIATKDGGFAIAGLTKSKGAGDLDCWLIKTSRDGFRQWDKTFGGKDADVANTILQGSDGGYLLAGNSKSQRSGARFTDAYFVKTTSGGELEWEQFMGKDRDDAVKTAYQLHNGSMVFYATMDGNNHNLLRLSDPQTLQLAFSGARDLADLEVSEFTIHSADGTLTPGQHSYASFVLTNKSDVDLNDFRVAVDNRSGADLQAWSTSFLGALEKDATMTVRIPMDVAKSINSGDQKLDFNLSSGNRSVKSFEKTVTLRTLQPAALLITDHQFNQSGRSDEITLKVKVQNTGDASSGPAEMRFTLPNGLKATSSTVMPMGVVGAHSQRDMSFVFLKTPQFSNPVASISCVILENGTESVRKTFDYQTGSGNSGVISGGPILIWTDPAPHETGTNKVRKSDDHFEFKMTVVSPNPINTKNIKMKVNGIEMDGSKFNEEDLSPPRIENTRYTYTYRNKIPLQQGSNRVEVVVGDQVSDPLEVEFTPQRANLFVLSIGPHHEDLQYTAKDAMDFGDAFKDQGGANALFNQVFVKTLTTPEETNMMAIKQAMFDLAYQWTDGQIKPNDVLILFFSSHGKIVENRFKILQTGYNPKYDRLTVDFKSDILETLSPINCKKLIFLDACHSGGAKEGFGGVSQAVVELAKTQPGVSTLTSCGSTEKSYENKSWENGAFTEALLNAFNGTTCSDATGQFQADKDQDGILRLGELYDFLRRRVPELVKAEVPNAPTSQTPFMPESELDKQLPLYILKK